MNVYSLYIYYIRILLNNNDNNNYSWISLGYWHKQSLK